VGAQRLLISWSELTANSLAVLPPVETAAPLGRFASTSRSSHKTLAAEDLTINTIGVGIQCRALKQFRTLSGVDSAKIHRHNPASFLPAGPRFPATTQLLGSSLSRSQDPASLSRLVPLMRCITAPPNPDRRKSGNGCLNRISWRRSSRCRRTCSSTPVAPPTSGSWTTRSASQGPWPLYASRSDVREVALRDFVVGVVMDDY
jgi:hypothetical protein